MKKKVSLLIAVLLLISLAACAKDVPSQQQEEPVSASTENNQSMDPTETVSDLPDTESEPASQVQPESPSSTTENQSVPTDEVHTDAPASGGATESPVTGNKEEESAAGNSDISVNEPVSGETTTTEEDSIMKMNVQVGGVTFTATLEENEAVSSLVEMMRNAPVVIQMSDYSGFEKVGPLGTSLPTSNAQTTTYAGDIVLYNGNQIVIFYGSNSWSYTRLGKIDDLTGWAEALGSGDVTVTFSLK